MLHPTARATINYNMLDLPQTIPGKSLTYTYDATGNKLRKTSGSNATDYIAGIQYDNGSITFIQTEEGRVLNPTGTQNYEYSLTDNLGNSRRNFDSSHGGSAPTQVNDYYPFGLNIQPSSTSPPNNYLYNRKELQPELTEYDYGARFYDPVIGRWNTVDPLAEKYRKWSTYTYELDNPVRFHDPDGMGPTDWVKIGNTVTFYADINSDEEAKARFGDGATDVTANGQSFIYTGSNNRQVVLYPGSFENWDYTDGKQTNTVIREYSEPLEAKSEGLETADKINTGIGLVNTVHGAGIAGAMKSAGLTEETLEESKDISSGFKAFKNITRGLGLVTTGVDAGISIKEAWDKPTAGNITKAIFKSAIFASEIGEYTNPVVGVGIALLDATGVTDKIYQGIGQYLGSAGPAKPKVAPVNGNMTL